MEKKNYDQHIDTWQIYNQEVIFLVNSVLCDLSEWKAKKFYVLVINQNSVSTPIPRLAAAINRSMSRWVLTRGVLKSGPAPQGAIRGRAPINHCLFPPKRELIPPSKDCAPRKLTCLGLLECNSRPETPKILVITPEFLSKNCFFSRFCKLHLKIHQISVYFGERPFRIRCNIA